MNPISDERIDLFIKSGIESFHASMEYFLDSASLPELLRNENPYQLTRCGSGEVDVLIRSLLDKHLEQWETRHFDDVLENLAVRVAEMAYGGWKSEHEGIDLEFRDGNAWHVVALTPFPCFDEGNEILEIEDYFNDATHSIKRDNPSARVVHIIGCVYGREPVTEKDDYNKYCGQDFWELISGDSGLYTRIVEPLGQVSARRNEKFREDYARKVNRLSAQFCGHFCDGRGAVDWEKLTAFVSAKGREPVLD